MIKQEHISLLRDNERVMMTLHRHWIILVAHFSYVAVLIISSIFLLAYRESMMSITGGAMYW